MKIYLKDMDMHAITQLLNNCEAFRNAIKKESQETALYYIKEQIFYKIYDTPYIRYNITIDGKDNFVRIPCEIENIQFFDDLQVDGFFGWYDELEECYPLTVAVRSKAEAFRTSVMKLDNAKDFERKAAAIAESYQCEVEDDILNYTDALRDSTYEDFKYTKKELEDTLLEFFKSELEDALLIPSLLETIDAIQTNEEWLDAAYTNERFDAIYVDKDETIVRKHTERLY